MIFGRYYLIQPYHIHVPLKFALSNLVQSRQYTKIEKYIQNTLSYPHPVSPHHEVTEANIVVETDLAGRHSCCRQYLLGKLNIGHGLQGLVVVTELGV